MEFDLKLLNEFVVVEHVVIVHGDTLVRDERLMNCSEYNNVGVLYRKVKTIKDGSEGGNLKRNVFCEQR